MKLRTLITLGAVGGFLYVHLKRGGELTLDSLADTARELLGSAKHEATEAKERAQKRVIHDVAETIAEVTETR